MTLEIQTSFRNFKLTYFSFKITLEIQNHFSMGHSVSRPIHHSCQRCSKLTKRSKYNIRQKDKVQVKSTQVDRRKSETEVLSSITCYVVQNPTNISIHPKHLTEWMQPRNQTFSKANKSSNKCEPTHNHSSSRFLHHLHAQTTPSQS